MKLQKIYDLVAKEVDATVPGEIILAVAKKVKEYGPYDIEEAKEIIEEELSEVVEEEEMTDSMSEDEEQGYLEDPSFTGLCEDES